VLNKKYMRIPERDRRKKAPGRRLYRLWIGGERGLSAGSPERYPLSRSAAAARSPTAPLAYFLTMASAGGVSRNFAGLSTNWSNPTPSMPACTRTVTSRLARK